MNYNQLAKKFAQKYQELYFEISDYIYHHPEVGGHEYESYRYLTSLLEHHGFEVTHHYKNIETSFMAVFHNGDQNHLGFMAEYDALDGMDDGTKVMHGCGHNWIAASSVGAAIILSKMTDFFNGKIYVYGTPAEETFGAKVDMADRGGFVESDIIFQGHLSEQTILYPRAMAMNSLEFTFHGKSAHAAGAPYNGVNALDAVVLMLNGVNMMREQLKDGTRVHGIISNGGQAANVIPQRASVKLTMRSYDEKYLDEVTERVINCGKGAQLMTGATMSYEKFENSFLGIVNISTLQETMKSHLEAAGIKTYDHPLDSSGGSTDVGNVSHVVPTSYVQIAVEGDEEFCPHEMSAVRLSNSHYAKKKLDQVIEAYLACGLEIMNDRDLLQKIKDEFKENMNGDDQ